MTWLSTELDRLLAPDALQDVEGESLKRLQEMRAECQAVEEAVSYLRRVVQGRLAIVRAALEHGGEGNGGRDLGVLVEELPAIIGAGPPRPAGPGRLPTALAPDMEKGDLTAELDQVFDAGRIAELPEMSAAELRDIAERLGAMEVDVSHQRRALHERIDHLQAEIVRRYKSGQASADDLLT
jgi:hypothetical protein